MQLKGAAGLGHLGYHLAPNKAPSPAGEEGRRCRERELEERGTEERGAGRKERAPFSSCPLQREWPLTLCISLKSVHPPSLTLSAAQAAASPALAIQAQVQSSAGQRKKTDREKGLRGVKGSWGGGQRPWTYATTTGTGTAEQRQALFSSYCLQTFLGFQLKKKVKLFSQEKIDRHNIKK